MASKKRIYIIRHKGGSGGVHLVNATNQAQALRAVVENQYECDVASQQELVKSVGDGGKVIEASED